MTQPLTQPVREDTLPSLEAGDRLDRETFHALYEAMPPGTRAELIGGEVFMPSPMKRPHSNSSGVAYRTIIAYEDKTPGIESHCGISAFLGPESEPQPDLMLLIQPDSGGQVVFKDEYIIGAPELVIEIASATQSIDLHRKKSDYERHGVQEYIVVALRSQRVWWFTLQDEVFVERPFDADGLIRSIAFPGLWFDPVSLLTENKARARKASRRGLKSPEYAAFVAELARRKAANP